MKKSKIISAIAILAIAGTILSGCGSDPIKDDILTYMEKLPELQTIEIAINESLNTVIAENYVDDATLLAELESLVPASDELLKSVTAVVPATPELVAVHKQYLDSITSLNSGLAMAMDAVIQGDVDVLTQANTLLEASHTQGDEFNTALVALAKEHELEIK